MVFEWQDVDFLYNFVRTYKPTSILELGSGHSTVAMGKALYENGSGFLHSFESEEGYVRTTKSILDKRFPVKVVPCEIELESTGAWKYYPDLKRMPKSFQVLNHYDLIYVDGPPCKDDEYTEIEWYYRWLIVDGRAKTVEKEQEAAEKEQEENNKPLSVFIK
jgi:predicted O-methyltransferase YrrM